MLVTLTTEQPVILTADEQAAGIDIEEKIVFELTNHHAQFINNYKMGPEISTWIEFINKYDMYKK